MGIHIFVLIMLNFDYFHVHLLPSIIVHRKMSTFYYLTNVKYKEAEEKATKNAAKKAEKLSRQTKQQIVCYSSSYFPVDKYKVTCMF